MSYNKHIFNEVWHYHFLETNIKKYKGESNVILFKLEALNFFANNSKFNVSFQPAIEIT